MRLIGLTGGIACGKSTVLKLMLENGVGGCIDMDVVTRETQEPGCMAYRRIVKEFGDDVLDEDGKIDREALGELIFKDAAKRRKLNKLMWLPLALGLLHGLVSHFILDTAVVILDAPLLYETGLHMICSKVVVVNVEKEVQVTRLMGRDKRSRADAEARIESQMPVGLKAARAHFVISNNGTKEELMAATREVIPKLTQFTLHRFNTLWFYLVLGVAVLLALKLRPAEVTPDAAEMDGVDPSSAA
uniref:Dephospho-CoA kinase n=1 Tax=Phaeomonas parva TaxID=124430 RepID=A0A7S1XXY7_9STRA|mmetsp:Transcript_42782/g.134199  ORF Transcript_42782/g.134199 Transcript_42782/m.134199 type:complete len:245 (+) Transcript_42782:291-1025(+)